MSGVPNITDEERRRALRVAVEKRRERAQFKALVKSGEIDRAAALSDRRATDIKVEELLKSMPRIGKKNAKCIMALCEIAPNRRVRGLGRRQRERLSDAVAHWDSK
ncbi:integration host factor, actinobacterial type [Raoultibacter timonensis]|uniref:Integration host factor-like helix-two turn-helix domain-containing protein n=1 Tax=Raoultibacter timonensis TaxID=1907662 RepID=A0ABM7WF72_9ACTN|nr:integration host factor, actinobacterial type [Raoultibacter timonensis]BDE94873.1 hypothetical protein CE91St30_02060 [Raoultibacter timonensis]BDF49476.1 hypothetical protein CE91St31_02060 [Raoultibacter timonensis]